MPALKLAIVGTLGLATVAITAGAAEASVVDDPAAYTWCKPKGAADQTIVAGTSATLVWKSTGELVLEPVNHLAAKIWSSGTAGTGEQLCLGAMGTLAVKSAAGATLWEQHGNGSLPADPAEGYVNKHRAALSLTDCTLSSTYKTGHPSVSMEGNYFYMVTDEGTIWSKPGTCPIATDAAMSNGWCMDTSAERILVQSTWSELVWKTNGNLVLRGRGIDAGAQIWKAVVPTGLGKKLCFDGSGRLQVRRADDFALWTSSGGSTNTSYMLALDDCNLGVAPLDGTAPLWNQPRVCPQATMPHQTEVLQGASDVILVENDQATMAFDATGNLVLRSVEGHEFWSSKLPSGTNRRLAFQADGNLVIYSSAGTALWAPNVHGQGVDTLALEGCAFALKAGTTTKWTRGWSSCAKTDLDLPSWSMSASGEATLLRTEESRLVWQADGNLVLYTTRGSPVWSSNTHGRGAKLGFVKPISALEIFDGAGARIWTAHPSLLAGSGKLTLRNRCTFALVASGPFGRKTLNDTCTVMRHSFERVDGNSTFGAVMRNDLTASDDAGGPAANSDTAIDVRIFGHDVELLSVASTQREGQDGSDDVAVSIEGDAVAGVTFTTPPITFFERSQTFMAGPVPVSVTAGATGELGMSVGFGGGTLSIVPTAGMYATIEAGVGASCDVGGASAGVRGNLTIIELALPITLKVFTQDGQPKYTINGDLELASLSGSFDLYAEGYIDLWFGTISTGWSKELFSWSGVEWDMNLFSSTGTF